MQFNSYERIMWPLLLTWFVAMGLTGTASLAFAGEPDPLPIAAKPSPQQEVTPLHLYQQIISRADGQRCPMYPSDSRYAQQAFKRHGLIVGWVLTFDRLLRCGRDETRRSAKVRIKGHVLTYDPLQANTFWWDKR